MTMVFVLCQPRRPTLPEKENVEDLWITNPLRARLAASENQSRETPSTRVLG